MARVSAIKSDGDWRFGRGFSDYLTDRDSIAQSVVTRLRSFFDDWFLDINHGIDWLTLLGEPGTERFIDSSIRRQIIQTVGIASLDAMTFVVERSARKVSVEATATTIYGDTVTIATEVS